MNFSSCGTGSVEIVELGVVVLVVVVVLGVVLSLGLKCRFDCCCYYEWDQFIEYIPNMEKYKGDVCYHFGLQRFQV